MTNETGISCAHKRCNHQTKKAGKYMREHGLARRLRKHSRPTCITKAYVNPVIPRHERNSHKHVGVYKKVKSGKIPELKGADFKRTLHSKIMSAAHSRNRWESLTSRYTSIKSSLNLSPPSMVDHGTAGNSRAFCCC
jgi:hypothetical protein